ncbi:MAG: hypothetical protein ACLFPL_00395 [Candidatus Nanoarchaeia archaeon]
MNPKFNSRELHEFFYNFEEKNPAFILGLIIVSLGLYIFAWIYSLNKDLERLDDDAPNSTRGAILLVVFPFIWFFLMTFTKQIINENFVFTLIEVTVYILIYILALKYIMELCVSFSYVTKSRPIVWFAGILLGSFGMFAYFLGAYILLVFLVFLALTISAMQAELNVTYHKITMKKSNFSFYG